MLALLSYALIPVATIGWSYHSFRKVRKAVERERAFVKMDGLISKLAGLSDAVRSTGVRGRHAALCLNEALKAMQLVSECTEQFAKENGN